MPTYRVTGPDGRRFKLTGDSPPTENELEDVFSSLPGTTRDPRASLDTPSMRAAEFEGEKTYAGAAASDLLGSAGNAVLGAGRVVRDIAGGVGSLVGYGARVATAAPRVLAETAYDTVTGGDPTEATREEVEALIRDNPGLAMARGYISGIGERMEKSRQAQERGDIGESRYQALQTAGALVPGYYPVSKVGERAVGKADDGTQASVLDADPAAAGDLAAQLVTVAGPGRVARAVESVTGLPLARAGAAVGTRLGNAASRITAPLANKVNPEVLAAAQREGLDLPAGALSDSKVVPVAEAVAAKGIGGGQAATRYEKAFQHLTVEADHVANRASKLTDDIARGEAISKGFDAYKAKFVATKNALYKQAEIPTRMDLFAQAKGTVAILDEAIAGKEAASRVMGGAPSQDLKMLRDLRDGLTKTTKGPGGRPVRQLRDIQARDLMQARKELSQRIQAAHADPFAAANKGLLKKVVATLDGEIDDAIRAADPKLAAKIDAANAVYKDGLSKINSTFGKSIFKNAKEGKYDLIAQQVAKPSMSSADIPRILEVAGPEGAEAMRASVLSDIVSKAKNNAGQLTPQGLAREMGKFGDDKLAALLAPEQIAKLNDLSTLTQSLEKGSKVMSGSQTAFNARLGAYGAGSVVNPALALQALLGEFAYSKFVGSKVGQRWLTTGYRPLSGLNVAKPAAAGARAGQATTTLARRPEMAPRPAEVYPRAAEDDDVYGDRVAYQRRP